ncbi:cytochrome P450 [Thozetella sp. PMI_491]|nr:cytochrome P450 [Thozetella sp. PMI_491]
MLAQIFSPRGVTLLAAAESLLAIRLSPEVLGSYSHLQLIIAIFGVNYVALGVYYGLIYPLFLNPLRHLPGPKVVLGSIPRTLLDRGSAPGDLFLDLVNTHPKEDLLCLNILTNELLVIGARPLADLLVHQSYNFTKPENIRGFLKLILGDGLVVAEGDQHKFLRKNSQPAFSFRHIKDLYPMMWEKAITMTRVVKDELRDNNSGSEASADASLGTIELQAWTNRATLDIIGSAGLGREFNMLKKAEDPLLQLYEELLAPSTDKLFYFIGVIILGVRLVHLIPFGVNRRIEHISKSLDDICGTMVREKKEKIRNEGEKHFDILSLLIQSNNFSDKDLVDQLLTYLAAGHETTSDSLTWVCYLLSKHKHVQDLLRSEIRDALPLGDSLDLDTADLADLSNTLEQLPYLNGVINETLRLYPTVPNTRRVCIQDTSIGGHRIPKGTTFVISPWAIQRSPEIWGPDAAEFRPERWITDGKPNQTGQAASNYQFLTFLHGPRSCIGQGFAKAALRCLLASMVRSFSWELDMKDSDVTPVGVVTIKPAKGMYLKLKVLDS